MSRNPRRPAAVAIAAAVEPTSRAASAFLIYNATVFVSSGAIMMLEVVAGRIISKHLGSSVYTWTSVIGIVLAGIALGNYLGGLIADRHASKRTLAQLFILGSAMSGLVTILDRMAADWPFLWGMSWPMRVASHVAVVFFVPTLFLGMISPCVAKLALDLGRQKGRTIGDIYAWGTIGSIVGTFAAGFFLIAALGTSGVVWAVAGILALMGILYWRTSPLPYVWGAVVVGFTWLAVGEAAAARRAGEALLLRQAEPNTVLFSTESNYSHVSVIRIKESPDLRGMLLDTLLHSQINMANPHEFHYEYEKVYAAVTKRLQQTSERMRANPKKIHNLTIGGGGYVYPRYMSDVYPEGRTDVAEIDPVVTEAAHAAMGLPRDTPINCYHEDGRVMIDRLAAQVAREQGTGNREQAASGKPFKVRVGGASSSAGEAPFAKYDIIYCDAVHDYNVPPQLTSVELLRAARSIIADDGAYLINMIDIYDSGLLLGSLVNTMREVWPHVCVLVEGVPVSDFHAERNTFVIVGTNQPFDSRDLGALYNDGCRIYALTPDEMKTLDGRTDGLVLTDNYAPVENLLSGVVKNAAQYKEVGEWRKWAERAAARKNYRRAVEILSHGLARNLPIAMSYPMLVDQGNYYRDSGDCDEAVAKYRKALKVKADDVDALVGLMQCNAGDFETLTRLVDLQPSNPTFQFNLGRMLLMRGDHAMAVRHLAEAIRLEDGRFADAFSSLAYSLYKLDRLQEAINATERALAIDANHAQATHLRAALENVQTAQSRISERPDDAAAWLALGQALYELAIPMQDVDGARKAVEMFDKSIALNPSGAAAHELRGHALVPLGRFEEAAAAYREALRLDESRKHLIDRINQLTAAPSS